MKFAILFTIDWNTYMLKKRQWAAVSTQFAEMMDPPQLWFPNTLTETCHGYFPETNLKVANVQLNNWKIGV